MNVPSTLSELKTQRLRASFYAQDALVAFMLGAQIFIDGTGRAPRHALSAIYLCALSAPVCAVLLAALIRRLRLRHEMQSLPAICRSVLGPVAGSCVCLLMGVLFLCDALGALAMLSALGNARLFPLHQSTVIFPSALLVLFIAVTCAGVGLARLAYLSRRFIPFLLLLLSVLLVYREPLSNLFPLLGRSIPMSVQSALSATGAASCALATGFLPAGIQSSGPDLPRPRLKPLWIGGLISCALLLCVALSMPASALARGVHWSELLVHAGALTANGRFRYLLVVLTECFALLIALGGSIYFAVCALSHVVSIRLSRAVVFLLCAAAAAVLYLAGNAFVFALLPLRFVPALLLVAAVMAVDQLRLRRQKRRHSL